MVVSLCISDEFFGGRTDPYCHRRVGHGLTAIKYTLRQAQSAVDCARLLNRCINALSKPGYLR